MESILRIDNGNIAVMGGLIEDRVENDDRAVPALSRLPPGRRILQNIETT